MLALLRYESRKSLILKECYKLQCYTTYMQGFWTFEQSSKCEAPNY